MDCRRKKNTERNLYNRYFKMSRLISTNEEFIKLKDALIKDIKIIQTEQANSQKKIKLAEEIVQKTKVEYKKLNDEYIKLESYKNKCEEFIKNLQNENEKLTQQLRQSKQRNRYNYLVRTQNKNTEEFESEQEEEEEENNDIELEEEDITVQNKARPLITKNKPNKPPPKKKIKKGISNFI